MPLESRAVGESGVQVSVLGLGLEAAGDPPDGDCLERIEAAILNGITLFESSPAASEVNSETSVGRAIRALHNRSKVTLLTGNQRIPVSERPFRPALNPQSLLQQIDESRRRLGTDVIDLYRVSGFEDTASFLKSLEALHNLTLKGVIRAVGLEVQTAGQIKCCLKASPVHFVQGAFNFFERDAEKEILVFCREKKIGFLACETLTEEPTQRSLESSKNNADSADLIRAEEDRGARQKVRGHLKKIAESKRGTLAQWEMAWTLSRPGVISVLFGARNPVEISQSASFPLAAWTDEDFRQGDLALKEAQRPPSGLSRRIWKG